jgi:hypothetical protein
MTTAELEEAQVLLSKTFYLFQYIGFFPEGSRSHQRL